MQAEVMREKTFNIRMSAEESARMEAVSAHYALNAASLIRMLIKREADSLGIAAEPPKPTKKTSKAQK